MFLKAYTRIGQVVYIIFCMLRVGIIPLYAYGLHLYATANEGKGFLWSTYEDHIQLLLFLTLPLFVALCSWLWTANYELCRRNDAAPEGRFYPIVHRLAVAFTVPACMNVLTLFQWALYEIWAAIYWGCTAAIVILWLVSLIYWIVNLILRRRRKTVPDV